MSTSSTETRWLTVRRLFTSRHLVKRKGQAPWLLRRSSSATCVYNLASKVQHYSNPEPRNEVTSLTWVVS